jgi:putative ABC transport system permease protein
MMRNEALIVIGLGCTVGLAVGALVVSPYSHELAGSYRPALPLLGCGAVVAGGALLTLLGTLGPTRLALRRAPVEAVGIRD